MASLGTWTLQLLPYISRLDSGVCHLEHNVWSRPMATSRLGRSITADRSVGYYLRAPQREVPIRANTFTPLGASAL
jgi:hypothetical protein